MSIKPKILVVDDSIAIVNSLSAILGISGFTVDTAFNGSDALRKIHSANYDLIICDIEMPGISGLDFLARVRQDFGRDIEVILMTGYLEHDYFIEAIRLGASDFIRKPIDTKMMVRSIQDLLYRRSNRHDIAEFYNHLDSAEFQFIVSPKNFSKFAVSKIISSFLRSNIKVPVDALNELLVCVDEMVYNAFIHGTLKLSLAERSLDHQSLTKVIEDKLLDERIASKKISLFLKMDNLKDSIDICVEDEGDGFDFQSWLRTVGTDNSLEIEGHGHGLAMLYHLCDYLQFESGGRRVQVTKKLNNTIVNDPKLG